MLSSSVFKLLLVWSRSNYASLASQKQHEITIQKYRNKEKDELLSAETRAPNWASAKRLLTTFIGNTSESKDNTFRSK